MSTDIAQIASTVVTILAPFTPYLIETGKAAGQKWAETVAEKGGEVAWNKAKELWEKIQTHFGDDAKVKGAALIVSADPADETSQTMLAKVLGSHLKENPQFTQEVVRLLGGTQAIQEVLADRKSWIENVAQEIEGIGTQRISATENSTIKGVRQTKK